MLAVEGKTLFLLMAGKKVGTRACSSRVSDFISKVAETSGTERECIDYGTRMPTY